MQFRQANTRGHFQNHWLNSYHSFSFSGYHDSKHMKFSLLRVLNDDVIAPKQGFGAHPHKDMEIITFMLSGSIEHKDNMGNKHRLEAGNVQLMRAGTGVVHSEMNPDNIPAHLLQIWVFSQQNSLEPGWWEKSFVEKKNTVLVEPANKTTNIVKLNDSLTGNGILMEQNGYILAIHDDTVLDLDKFGTSDVYIHLPTEQAQVIENGHTWDLKGGDALYQENMNNKIEIKPQGDVVLVFVFPK